MRINTVGMSTVFFDLDGTLTDPKIGITRSVRYALNELQAELAICRAAGLDLVDKTGAR